MQGSRKNETREERNERLYAWKRQAPATYVDTFEIGYIPGAQIMRIAFGEFAGRGASSILRVAVATPVEDARALANTLLRMIADEQTESDQSDV